MDNIGGKRLITWGYTQRKRETRFNSFPWFFGAYPSSNHLPFQLFIKHYQLYITIAVTTRLELAIFG